MRIFPRPYADLDAAFPQPEAPLPCNLRTTSAIVLPFLLGQSILGAGLLFKRPGIVRTSYYTTVTATTISLAATYATSRREASLAQNVLGKRGVEIPPRKWAERWARFDIDNGMILGAAVGAAFAGARRSPYVFTRLQQTWRTAASGISGAAIGILSGFAFLADTEKMKRDFEALRRGQDLQTAMIQHSGLFPGMQISHIGASPGAGIAAFGGASAATSFGSTSSDSSASNWQSLPEHTTRVVDTPLSEDQNGLIFMPGLNFGMGNNQDIADPQPHLSVTNGFDDRSYVPSLNYSWLTDTSPADARKSLQAHIKHLTEKREALSKDAQHFWSLRRRSLENIEALSDAVDASGSHIEPVLAEQATKADADERLFALLHLRAWDEVNKVNYLLANSEMLLHHITKRANQTTPKPRDACTIPEKECVTGSEQPETKFNMALVMMQLNAAIELGQMTEQAALEKVHESSAKGQEDPVLLDALQNRVVQREAQMRVMQMIAELEKKDGPWRLSGVVSQNQEDE